MDTRALADIPHHNDSMKTTEEMVELNREQARFYDSIQSAQEVKHDGYAHNKKANIFTRSWSRLRQRQQVAVRRANIEEAMKNAHRQWIAKKSGGEFLEIGCFSGSASTFSLVEASKTYLGIELSQKAVDALNAKFIKMGVEHKAKAVAMDFLTMERGAGYDLIYAHGVLHHFENPFALFETISKLLKDDGMLIFVDPIAVNPMYRIIRACYRPLQSDAAWEWPFTRTTIQALEEHFEVIEGFGWGARSLPLSVVTTLPLIGDGVVQFYLRTIKAEVERGWHKGVWNNSMVTAMARRKRPTRP